MTHFIVFFRSLALILGAVINGGWTISTHSGSDTYRDVINEDGIIFEGPANGGSYANWKFLFTIGGDRKLGFAATRDNGVNWTAHRFE